MDQMTVYRLCDGMIEDRFTGSKQECLEWVSKRGDTNRASYYILPD